MLKRGRGKNVCPLLVVRFCLWGADCCMARIFALCFYLMGG